MSEENQLLSHEIASNPNQSLYLTLQVSADTRIRVFGGSNTGTTFTPSKVSESYDDVLIFLERKDKLVWVADEWSYTYLNELIERNTLSEFDDRFFRLMPTRLCTLWNDLSDYNLSDVVEVYLDRPDLRVTDEQWKSNSKLFVTEVDNNYETYDEREEGWGR